MENNNESKLFYTYAGYLILFAVAIFIINKFFTLTPNLGIDKLEVSKQTKQHILEKSEITTKPIDATSTQNKTSPKSEDPNIKIRAEQQAISDAAISNFIQATGIDIQEFKHFTFNELDIGDDNILALTGKDITKTSQVNMLASHNNFSPAEAISFIRENNQILPGLPMKLPTLTESKISNQDAEKKGLTYIYFWHGVV
mgnify:CR=1 FL=1